MVDRLNLTLTTMLVVLFIIQIISVVFKKRKEKNFYQEFKVVDFLSKFLSVVFFVSSLVDIFFFEENILTGSKIYLLVILLVVTVAFLFLTRNFFSSKDFIAVNIKDDQFLSIASQILRKYELNYEISENLSESLITLDQGEAVIKIKPEGIVSTSLSVKFIRFSEIYCYEDIIAEMKDQINKTTKINSFRGLIDLALVILLLAFIIWISAKM